MAKILETKDYINENVKIRQALEQNNVNSRIVEATPTYVVYFKQQELESMASNLGVDQYIGPRSPIRFSEIEDFPLYINQTTQLELNEEEQGMDVEFNVEAGVLQGTLVPIMNDFVYIKYLSEDYLFRVSGVATDTIRAPNTHYYRINLSLFRVHSPHDIRRQVTEVLIALEDNIGTEKRVLITKREGILIDQIDSQYEFLKKTYVDFFWMRKFNSFICNEKFHAHVKLNFVSFYSEYFMKKHNLMYDKRDNSSIFILLDDEFKDLEHYPEYFYSIYGTLERKDIDSLKARVMHESKIENPLSILGGYQYGITVLTPSEYGWSKSIFPNDDLVDRIKFNKPYLDKDNKPLENILIQYFNNSVKEIYDFRKHVFPKDVDTYIIIPLVLFVLAFIKQNILIKQTKGGNKLCSNS